MNLIQMEIKNELERFFLLLGNEIISNSNNAEEYEQTEIIKKSLNEFLENFEKFNFNSEFQVCTLKLRLIRNRRF